MSHIHTDPGQYDLTASAYIVRLDTIEPTVMLHQHKILHKYLQFGGHVELHESPWQALAHEIIEESGYSLEQLLLLQPTLRMGPFSDATIHPIPITIQSHQFAKQDHNHTDIAYAFVTHEPPAHSIGEGESTIVKAFTIKELEALTDTEVIDNVRKTALFVLAEILPAWQRVSPNTFA